MGEKRFNCLTPHFSASKFTCFAHALYNVLRSKLWNLLYSTFKYCFNTCTFTFDWVYLSVLKYQFSVLIPPPFNIIASLFWFTFTLHFSVIECPQPKLENGVFTPSQNTYLWNNMITSECYSGYTLRGSSRRVCQSSGKWSGSTPVCVSSCESSKLPPSHSFTSLHFIRSPFEAMSSVVMLLAVVWRV